MVIQQPRLLLQSVLVAVEPLEDLLEDPLLKLGGSLFSKHPSWSFLAPYSALIPPSLVVSAS